MIMFSSMGSMPRLVYCNRQYIYSRAKGIEIAMLLRRLRSVTGGRGRRTAYRNHATLVGDDEKGFKQVVDFAEKLFERNLNGFLQIRTGRM